MELSQGNAKKRALITGITGQDGFYMAEFLLSKGYEIYGMYRRTAMSPLDKMGKIKGKVHLVEGDLIDTASLIKNLQDIKPDEVYNFASQSFVPSSWTQPLATGEITGMGVARMLEAIKLTNPKIRFFQASTSEMFGKVKETPQNENTPFYPRSPYGVSKVFAYWTVVNYRESFGIYACNGITFNHESPRRGKEFVTRKITESVAKIKLGLQDFVELGNLDAKRDWGFAGDYVEAMWMMLQQDKAEDYVISTGHNHSVRDFVEAAFGAADMHIQWQGHGLEEVGVANGKIVVKINPHFYRPAEVDVLLGNPEKIKSLGWKPKTDFKELVSMMVEADLNELKN
jgi:GDPmannose 4,6-dehydratase